MVPDEKSGRVPSPFETAGSSPRGRGSFGLVLAVAVYMTASLVSYLLLETFWRLVDEADE